MRKIAEIVVGILGAGIGAVLAVLGLLCVGLLYIVSLAGEWIAQMRDKEGP